MGARAGPRGLGLADPAPPSPPRPTDEEGFLHPPGETSSENYQIVKGVSPGPGGGSVGPLPRRPHAASPASTPAGLQEILQHSLSVKYSPAKVQMELF